MAQFKWHRISDGRIYATHAKVARTAILYQYVKANSKWQQQSSIHTPEGILAFTEENDTRTGLCNTWVLSKTNKNNSYSIGLINNDAVVNVQECTIAPPPIHATVAVKVCEGPSFVVAYTDIKSNTVCCAHMITRIIEGEDNFKVAEISDTSGLQSFLGLYYTRNRAIAIFSFKDKNDVSSLCQFSVSTDNRVQQEMWNEVPEAIAHVIISISLINTSTWICATKMNTIFIIANRSVVHKLNFDYPALLINYEWILRGGGLFGVLLKDPNKTLHLFHLPTYQPLKIITGVSWFSLDCVEHPQLVLFNYTSETTIDSIFSSAKMLKANDIVTDAMGSAKTISENYQQHNMPRNLLLRLKESASDLHHVATAIQEKRQLKIAAGGLLRRLTKQQHQVQPWSTTGLVPLIGENSSRKKFTSGSDKVINVSILKWSVHSRSVIVEVEVSSKDNIHLQVSSLVAIIDSSLLHSQCTISQRSESNISVCCCIDMELYNGESFSDSLEIEVLVACTVEGSSKLEWVPSQILTIPLGALNQPLEKLEAEILVRNTISLLVLPQSGLTTAQSTTGNDISIAKEAIEAILEMQFKLTGEDKNKTRFVSENSTILISGHIIAEVDVQCYQIVVNIRGQHSRDVWAVAGRILNKMPSGFVVHFNPQEPQLVQRYKNMLTKVTKEINTLTALKQALQNNDGSDQNIELHLQEFMKTQQSVDAAYAHIIQTQHKPQ